jgi:hypothetical protein
MGTEHRTTKEERSEILDLYSDSGLSKRQFAKDYGLNYKTFLGWFSIEEEQTFSNDCELLEVNVTSKRERSFTDSVGKERFQIEYPNGVKLSLPEEVSSASILELIRDY